jgi:hypothetical protein
MSLFVECTLEEEIATAYEIASPGEVGSMVSSAGSRVFPDECLYRLDIAEQPDHEPRPCADLGRPFGKRWNIGGLACSAALGGSVARSALGTGVRIALVGFRDRALGSFGAAAPFLRLAGLIAALFIGTLFPQRVRLWLFPIPAACRVPSQPPLLCVRTDGRRHCSRSLCDLASAAGLVYHSAP